MPGWVPLFTSIATPRRRGAHCFARAREPPAPQAPSGLSERFGVVHRLVLAFTFCVPHFWRGGALVAFRQGLLHGRGLWLYSTAQGGHFIPVVEVL